MKRHNAVLLIFTGGTISMAEDPISGALRPLDFERLQEFIPEIKNTKTRVDCYPFDPFIDSSDVRPPFWCELAQTIYDNYDNYDGFVVLHGTDTMSFSASALSFMLDNLSKPVIFTGSQLPVGMMRSDAKENLLTAIEIAAAELDGNPRVPEVCIFFEDTLFRGNRTTKKNAEHFNAFDSHNYPPLAKAGVHIKYNPTAIHYPLSDLPLSLHKKVDQNVAILKLFPGITEHTVNAILNIPHLRAVVLETFGSGNAPQHPWFYQTLKKATEQGIIIVNKTQCSSGAVEMGRYETSLNLLSSGVISGHDITTEALVTKLMYLLGEHGDDIEKVRELLQQNLCGEMTIEE